MNIKPAEAWHTQPTSAEYKDFETAKKALHTSLKRYVQTQKQRE